MCSGTQMALECRCYGVIDEEWQYTHSCALMNLVGIIHQLKGRRTVMTEMELLGSKMCLYLRLNFFHYLGYVPSQSFVVACRYIGQTVCAIVDCSIVVSPDILQDW